jgi:hypothetical protein
LSGQKKQKKHKQILFLVAFLSPKYANLIFGSQKKAVKNKKKKYYFQ